MTEAAISQSSSHDPVFTRFIAWVGRKDPDFAAVKRSVRAAVVMPAVFAIGHLAFSDSQIGLFGAFGSFALLLLVDFPGRPRTRLFGYIGLFGVGVCLISLGTVASSHEVVAVVSMFLVGFAVLFAGIVLPQAAIAATAALLLFVLPVAVVQPISEVGPRLVGWALAGAFCIPACMLIWPTPWHDDLRRRLSAAVSAVGALAEAHSEGRRDPEGWLVVTSELSLLRKQFGGTPYPPTSSAARAVALTKLVGRVEWVAGNAVLVEDQASSLEQSGVRRVIGAAAETLKLSASLICDSDAHPVDDPLLVESVRDATERLDRVADSELEADVSSLIEAKGDRRSLADRSPESGVASDGPGIAAALDPSFHARALAIATAMLADAAIEASGAQTVRDRRLGIADERNPPAFWGRLASYFSFRSIWFRNAVRGAVGLALAVAVIEITEVEHGFWVVLGTLSVLRSNALGTGSTALRAVGGTAAGVVVGAALMVGLGSHTVVLWLLLPIAVLISGAAPSMISFAAGQAGFTVVVVVLFNIIDPTGWRVGLTRIEDVGIGCAVSVVVGLLFWPRGATAAFGRSLSDAFVANSAYLADAVDRLTTTDRHVDTMPTQRAAHRAYLRLDDAFRQYLAERGAKVVSIETIARLFTGANRIRLAAYTLAGLPLVDQEPGMPELEPVAIAGAVLRDSYASSHRWYEQFAELLADRRRSLDAPPVHHSTLDAVLRQAFDDARAMGRSRRSTHHAPDAVGRRVARLPAPGAGRPQRLGRSFRSATAPSCDGLNTSSRAGEDEVTDEATRAGPAAPAVQRARGIGQARRR